MFCETPSTEAAPRAVGQVPPILRRRRARVNTRTSAAPRQRTLFERCEAVFESLYGALGSLERCHLLALVAPPTRSKANPGASRCAGDLNFKIKPSPSIADAMDVHLRPCAHRDTLMSEVNRQQTKINYSPVFFLNIIFKNGARGGRPTVGRLAANQWTRGWKFQLRDRQRRFYACRACRPPWERAVTRLLRRLGCSAALRGCPAGEPKAI